MPYTSNRGLDPSFSLIAILAEEFGPIYKLIGYRRIP
jgi:hypothetical protein